MRRARGLVASLTVLALAGCIPPASDTPPAPSPAPAPVVVEAPAPVVTAPPAPIHANWHDAPLTAGDWRWRQAGGESFAEFLSPSGQMLFQFNCTSDHAMIVAAVSTDQSANALHIRSEFQDRTLTAAAREGWLEARLDAHDPLLDAIAFSRGRFAAEAGAQGLYLPAYPEITRVIEDCR